jgi:hypothetical protein
MFYLIGVNHDAQRRAPKDDLTPEHIELESCLKKAIDDYHPELIAVEENEEHLKNKKTGLIDISIPGIVAACHGIKTLFCDPTTAQRVEIGYRDAKDIQMLEGLGKIPAQAIEMALFFRRREEFWICRLSNYLNSEVIFVCGENHLETFSARLESRGVESKVICKGIGVSRAQRADYQAALKFKCEDPDSFINICRNMSSPH